MQIRHILLYGIIAVSFILLIGGFWYRTLPDLDIGKRLVDNSCGVCHDLTSEKKHERGPYLWGVYKRPAGSTGFHYSEAFLAKLDQGSFIWDDEHLEQFIANPKEFIPRTEMGKHDAKHPTAFTGVVSSSNRKDVLAYIKTLQ
ncbi:MAG: c-type cytochrome [Magnetococcales bacterium]|nr:c-type cytochrome [Magnetococcales bacterium]